MAKRSINRATDADYLAAWEAYKESFRRIELININETTAQKTLRIAKLEKQPEEWFKYYFPNYCTAAPANFHLAATKRLLNNPEWFEVRAWARELAKSSRSMMEIIYLALTGKIRNLLCISATYESAVDLLLPFKTCFESNARISNDYGEQVKFGKWEAGKFTIKKGCQFRAMGWGTSPRGKRNEEKRPDFILIDDFDTDEECRNEDIMKNKIKWLEEALIPTRSISGALRILVNGNIIHDNCAVKYLGEKADKFDIVNVRDAAGKSTWAAKNSEEAIDRVLSIISFEAAQKEYFNNPMDGGDTFKDLKEGKVPNLQKCSVIIYADPATSNRDKTSGSDKAIGLIAKQGMDYYVVRCACDTMSNAKFVSYLFEFYTWATANGAQNVRVFIENNTLQNPFYEQVILPLVYNQANATQVFLPITPDTRQKPEKWTRIEGTLEPLNRLGHLIFNVAETDEPNMKRLKAQFKNASRKQKKLDGPDMVEGAVIILREIDAVEAADSFEIIKKRRNKF